MGQRIQDLKPGLARRMFDQMVQDSAKRVSQPVIRPSQLDAPKPNDGRTFQDAIVRTAAAYKASRVLKLEKADPPTKIVGRGKIIFMENPFPDFLGVHHDGRMIALEAKSTQKHLLPFNRDGGLTVKQVNLLIDWGEHGAASGVLWQYNSDQVRCLWIGWREIKAQRANMAKSLRFFDYYAQGRVNGAGLIEWDFAPYLDRSKI